MITGLYMSVFGGSLSLLSLLVSFQHRSALAGDSLLRRGAKIASAYAIPVVGGALSESLDNITLGLVTLKSSFGFGAALLIVLSLLPGIVSVILYRMVFILFSAFCVIKPLRPPEKKGTSDSLRSALLRLHDYFNSV